MSHSNTIVNGNSIELCGITAHFLDFGFYNLPYLMKMGVTRHKLSK